MLIGGITSRNDPPEPATEEYVPNDYDAYYAAIDVITPRLKAPSTAKFPTKSHANMSQTAPNTWHIVCYVDSQNSFGAMIRTYYSCDAVYEKDKALYMINNIRFVSP